MRLNGDEFIAQVYKVNSRLARESIWGWLEQWLGSAEVLLVFEVSIRASFGQFVRKWYCADDCPTVDGIIKISTGPEKYVYYSWK